jgi:uncharacterized protein YecE (DUF72 family)
MARIRIGTSGYSYASWRGVFYPSDLAKARELEFASRAFTSIEINRSFYSLLTPASCRAWFEATPQDFVFALKGSSFITHSKKLRNVRQALANFFAAGPLALGEKLGPVVWQLPTTTAFNEPVLSEFLELLPRTRREAAKLARDHDERVRHGAHLEVSRDGVLRHALEARHTSFFTPECARLLRKHNVALAISESPTWELVEEPTADFMYLRLHGSQKLYASRYGDAELDRWATRVVSYAEGREPEAARRIEGMRSSKKSARDVYVYFDNDAHGHAALDAQGLLSRITSATASERKVSAMASERKVSATPRRRVSATASGRKARTVRENSARAKAVRGRSRETREARS